jgi:uncharacterized OB-fold protein
MEEIKMVKLPTVICNRCGHKWIPRVENPRWCSKCRSPYWNKERINKKNKGEILNEL